MKKIITLIIFSVIVFVIVLYNYKPIVLKYLSGNAIILEKVKNYTVTIHGNEYEEVLFRDNNKLILFLKNQNISNKYSIISIEIKNNFFLCKKINNLEAETNNSSDEASKTNGQMEFFHNVSMYASILKLLCNKFD